MASLKLSPLPKSPAPGGDDPPARPLSEGSPTLAVVADFGAAAAAKARAEAGGRLTLGAPRPNRAPEMVPVYGLAGLASFVWVAALWALAYGFGAQPFGVQGAPVRAALFALVGAAPLGLIWAAAYLIGEGRLLGAEVRRAQRVSEELIGPTALAAAQTSGVLVALQDQIASATVVAQQAKDSLSTLRQALAGETARLAEATADATRTAGQFVDTISRERGELTTLAVTLDARVSALTDAINHQSRTVADASDLAEAQIREAEAALAARAADLAAAAGEAVDVSRVAADDLGRQIDRLEAAGGGVGDQVRALEKGIVEQRVALVTAAQTLRTEQEAFASLAESRGAQLAEFISAAQSGVLSLNESTDAGARALSQLIVEAQGRLRELAVAAGAERDAFARSAEGALKNLSEAGSREREQLETSMRLTIEVLTRAAAEAREAADRHAQAARERVDLLNEAAFTAAQNADQAFEQRLVQARGLIEKSAHLVEEAGQQATLRLEAQAQAARAGLQGLHALMDDVSARAARLPEEAGRQVEAVKGAMDKGLGDLLASAHRTADETQAIDAAFQARVRRNYEMLSEAVQLMGVVAERGQQAPALQRPPAAERARSRVAAARPAPEPPPGPPAAEIAPEPAPAPAQPPPASSSAPPVAAAPRPEAAEGPPLRARLRLAPTASDAEFKAVFKTAIAPAQAPEEPAWTWKELLKTTLADSAAGAEGRPAESLYAEIGAMGVDPAALLPGSRLEEIAAAIRLGERAGAREVVRALAPAALRRIGRRMLSDARFRRQAHAFLGPFGEALAVAALRDPVGAEAAGLLATEAGRTFLLLDAASARSGGPS